MAGSTDIQRLLLSTPEVAQRLGVSERFIKNLISSGALPSLKIGRLRRIVVSDLERWIDDQRNRR